MAQLFNMPQLGSTMEEGLVVLWKRSEGEAIHKGETLLEVETDKTIVEVQAPCDGVLHKILASPETRVPIHQPIAILGQEHEDIAPLLAGLSRDRDDKNIGCTDKNIDGEPATMIEGEAVSGITDFAISPRARRLADERGVSLALLAGCGTGPDGRVIERDVLAYLEKPAHLEAKEARQREATQEQKGDVPISDLSELALGLPGSQVRPLPAPLPSSPTRSTLYHPAPASAQAAETWESAPTASMTLEVDMTACLALHAQLMSAVNTHYRAALDCVHIAVKATARALERVPQLNAVTTDAGLTSPSQIDIAVFTPVENELAIQIVEHVGTRTLGAVSAALTGFAGHQSASLLAEKVRRSFIVVMLTDEVDRFHPALPTGHVAALGLGRIAQRPVASNGQIVARTTLHLCLTYAAASVDTALAARFLQRLKELLEAPAQILI